MNGPSTKLSAGISRSPRARAGDDARLERERRDGQLGRGVGVGEAAAERPARANRDVADVPRGEREEPVRAAQRRPLEPRVPDEGAELELAVPLRDAVEARDAVDVDDVRRPEEPVREHGHEALPAGEELRLAAASARSSSASSTEPRPRVRERRQLHVAQRASVAARIGP